jgi:hypothetical protein
MTRRTYGNQVIQTGSGSGFGVAGSGFFGFTGSGFFGFTGSGFFGFEPRNPLP